MVQRASHRKLELKEQKKHIAICPKGAVSQEGIYSLPKVDMDKCIKCGKCVKLCPKGAIGAYLRK
jgi:Fe-S-cluster-containing hydrogenase component 2